MGSPWGRAVGQVWDFIRSQSDLCTDGHNVFAYDHAKAPDSPLLCEFGVEVTRTLEAAGEVSATERPAAKPS